MRARLPPSLAKRVPSSVRFIAACAPKGRFAARSGGAEQLPIVDVTVATRVSGADLPNRGNCRGNLGGNSPRPIPE